MTSNQPPIKKQFVTQKLNEYITGTAYANTAINDDFKLYNTPNEFRLLLIAKETKAQRQLEQTSLRQIIKSKPVLKKVEWDRKHYRV
ncbi:hypothetical protein [Listeria grandensis]|uniref:hypothetical protein n=1 Tax=Listeria grandensis TaxID=1494963 RepID=UPI00164E268D|nr:hypothetical protein [Listeria grandensis]MBC6314547.1 hypothetical protein [Listeria grandensis]